MPYLRAIAGGFAPFIAVTNLATARLVPPATLPPSTANDCAFSPDGAFLAVAHAGSPSITIYNTSDWSTVSGIAALGSTGPAYGVAFSPDGTLLAVCHQGGGYFHVYNTNDWSRVSGTPSISTSYYGRAIDLTFSSDGTLLAVAHGENPYITIYNTSDWSTVSGIAALPDDGNGVAFSPDDTLLAVAHNGSPYITIYNTSDWSKVEDFTPIYGSALGVSFSVTGALTIKGEVRDIDGLVASRKVRAYVRSSGDKCAETTSSALDGTYELQVYEGDVEYDIQFMADPLENLNDLFYARTTGGTVP